MLTRPKQLLFYISVNHEMQALAVNFEGVSFQFSALQMQSNYFAV